MMRDRNYVTMPFAALFVAVALGGCTVVVSGEPECGNGTKEFNEDCDGADLGGATCESAVGRGSAGMLGCTSACQFETVSCSAPWTCGDDICHFSETEESCATDCSSFDCGDQVCQPTEHVGICPTDCPVSSTCGNGLRDLGEDCDGEDLRGGSCTDLGFGGGALGCDHLLCIYNTQACTAWETGYACTLSEQCLGGLCLGGMCTVEDCFATGCALLEQCISDPALFDGAHCYRDCVTDADCHPNFVCRDVLSAGTPFCWFPQ